MSKSISFDYKNSTFMYSDTDMSAMKTRVEAAKKVLLDGCLTLE